VGCPGGADHGARVGGVLVIDGDPQWRLTLVAALGSDAHEVEVTATAAVGTQVATASLPDLVIVDAGLEDGSGASVCAALRREYATRGVLVLVMPTVGSEAERVAAFEAGADDCMTRPFSTRELLLRVRALLRRVAAAPRMRPFTELVEVGSVRIDRASRRVTANGVPVGLTRREFDLLLHRVDARGRALSRESVLGDLWRGDAPSERVVDTTLRRLRNKLPALAPHIRTLRGVGYELTAEEPESSK
jgi:two-component system phosphate regulon response regulator PhoB